MAAETFKRVASPRAQEFIKDRAALKMMHHRMGELVGHDEIQETKITAERRSPKSSYNPPLEHDEEMARMSRNRRAGEAAAAAALARAEAHGIDLDGIAPSPRSPKDDSITLLGDSSQKNGDELLLEMLLVLLLYVFIT